MIRLLIFISFCLLSYSCENAKTHDDIYINQLVYNKSDNTLFSGLLESSDEGSTLKIRFNEGKPTGDWIEEESGGGIVQKGTYETKKIKLNSVKKELRGKLFLINYWQEGESTAKSPINYLTISIIEKDSFFSSNNESNLKDHLRALFEKIKHDLLNVKCSGVYLEYNNAVYDWDKSYYLFYDSESKIIEFNKYGSW